MGGVEGDPVEVLIAGQFERLMTRVIVADKSVERNGDERYAIMGVVEAGAGAAVDDGVRIYYTGSLLLDLPRRA